MARPERPERPERRDRAEPALEPATRETLDTYRQLLNVRGSQQPSQWRFVKRGAVGLALFGLAGWAWKQQAQRPTTPERSDESDTQD
jgi:hypothetical protein